MLRQLQWNTMSAEDRSWLEQRGSTSPETDELRASIAALVADVRTRGDAALVEALATFDGVTTTASGLRVTNDEFAAAELAVTPELRDAIRTMITNITKFNEALLERRGSWTAEIAPGHTVGETIGPIDTAAIFCPSGKASYPSVLAQVATPAVVAGVRQITVITPPLPGGNGELDPAVLVVARELGIDQVFRVNGPSGVAAAAFGTETIPAHGMVVGPGSPPVAFAQLEVRAHGVESVLMGPTESMVIADSSANIELLAADLLNEAEHGTDSTVVLVATDQTVIDEVDLALSSQAADLPTPRREAAIAALGTNGGSILVNTLDEAIDVANWFAAEHCQLAVADAWAASSKMQHAGELLVGQNTPFAAGNFTLGGPAALPTGGFAKRAGGITVENFLKAMAIGHLEPAALQAIADATVLLAEHEGFPAHARSVTIRSTTD